MNRNIAYVTLLLLAGSCLWDKEADKTRKVAREIIKELENYRVESGIYPDSLAQLTPKYLKERPVTFYSGANNFFYYRKDSANNYELWYFANLGVEARYFSSKKEWQYDD